MFDQIVATLVNRLRITSGRGTGGAEDPAYQSVLSALLGHAETTVVVVDTLYTGNRWVILGAIDDNDSPRFPLLVKAHLHKGADPSVNWGCACSEVLPRLQSLGWLGREDKLTTEEVGEWFVGRCNGIGDDAGEFPASWAAGAAESFAPVTIDGDLGERVARTADYEFDPNFYEWYDLKDVPLAGSVWRLSATETLWVFTRREADRWEVTIVPAAVWAPTDHHDGSKDFGTLLDGAREAFQLMQRASV